MEIKNPGILYVVGTPIGHLGDITDRAQEVLRSVSWILCEDTRHTRTLTRAYGIETPLLSYHEHNAAQRRPKVLAHLAAGGSLALVSDAGMPLISDPGYKLVQACLAESFDLTVIPGPSAVLAGLCSSGLPSDRFFFQGFLPTKPSARLKVLESLQHIPATLVFFEAPHRVKETLESVHQIFGNRQASLSRELTKKFEETRRGTLEELIISCVDAAPRGEITVVVKGAPEQPLLTEQNLDTVLQERLRTLSLKEAVRELFQETGIPRHIIYQKALKHRSKDV